MMRSYWLRVLVILVFIVGTSLLGVQLFGQEQIAPRKMTTKELADWIDARFAADYAAAGVKPAEMIDDETFLRRVHLDLLGCIPSVAQLRDFRADKSSRKREQFVDQLLNVSADQNRYAQRSANHLARVWRRVLIPSTAPGVAFSSQLDPWLAKQFAENTRYDDFARKLLLARPAMALATPTAPNENPDAAAAVFQQAIGMSPENLTTAYVRVFLGVRLNCAQCHDHPFTEWTREDFWGMAALFGDGMSVAPMAPPPEALSKPRPAPTIRPVGDEQVTFVAKLLWDEKALSELPAEKTSRDVLAQWLVSPQNPNFAPTAVNRIWQYLCGRGLAGPVDELDSVTPDERAALDELAVLFVENDYDVRWLITGICQSKVYQQASSARSNDAPDGLVRRPLKTLLPEQVFDSLEQALGLSIGKTDNGPRHNGEREQFVARMNESAPDTPEDFKGGIPQALMLMNGKLTADATSLESSRTLRAVVEAPFLKPPEKVEALFLATLSRAPNERELQYLVAQLEAQASEDARKQVYANMMWGLLNSPEFVLSR